MKIGFSTANYFAELNTEESLDLYGQLGVQTCEVFLNTFSETTPEFIRKLNEVKANYDLSVNSVHFMSAVMEPCLFDRHLRRRQDFFALFDQSLDCIKALGSDIYTFHGIPKTMVGDRFAEVVAIYDELAKRAWAKGVRLAQENVAYLAAGDLSFLKELKEAMTEPLFYTLDVKQARRAKQDISQMISFMGDRLVNVHISDAKKGHLCLNPGDGDENFLVLFEKLKAVQYQGNVIIELYRENFKDDQDLLKGQNIIADTLQFAGFHRS